MKLDEFLSTKDLTMKQYKCLEKENKKELKKEYEDVNRIENTERQKILKEKYQQTYQKRISDTTDEEIYKSLYEHISSVFGPFSTRYSCSGKPKLLDKYLKKYAKSVFCKPFLEKVAKHFWRMLHLQIGESCKAAG